MKGLINIKNLEECYRNTMTELPKAEQAYLEGLKHYSTMDLTEDEREYMGGALKVLKSNIDKLKAGLITHAVIRQQLYN